MQSDAAIFLSKRCFSAGKKRTTIGKEMHDSLQIGRLINDSKCYDLFQLNFSVRMIYTTKCYN